MASFLYFVLCGALAVLATFELKTHDRAPRIQLYITLLGALTFCGLFALLLTAAQAANGAYQTPATLGVLLLTAGSLYAFTRVFRRFRASYHPRHNA